MNEPHTEYSDRKLKIIGLWVTFVYVAVLVICSVALTKSGWLDLKPLELNQFGDLLAGLFGPLAIFWLILGFFQQGDELRNSVHALRLQAEELKQSVEQQKAMVTTAERQLQLDIEVREEQNRLLVSRELPYFQLERRGGSGTGNSSWNHDFLIRNIGASAANVQITPEGKSISAAKREVPFLDTTHSYEFSIQSINTTRLTHDGPAHVEILSENNRGKRRFQKFELSDDGPPKLISCTPEQT